MEKRISELEAMSLLFQEKKIPTYLVEVLEAEMNIIFLDDDKTRQAQMKSRLPCIKQVWTADEAIETIKLNEERLDAVFLDHDLGGEIYVDSNIHNTGMTVARWLSKNPQDIDVIVIHTYNPVGGKNMYNELKNKYRVANLTFLSEYFVGLVKGLNRNEQA